MDLERILDYDDRNFPVDLGHWVGDAIWMDLPFWYGGTIATLYVDAGGPSKQMSLSYPHISPFINAYHTLGFRIIAVSLDANRTYTYRLTDGIREFTESKTIPPLVPQAFYIKDILIPKDWIVPSTLLEITINSIPAETATFGFDDFQLLAWALKPQMLPFMGIG